MSWEEWPHTVTVAARTQTPDEDGILQDPVAGSTTNLKVQIETSSRTLELTGYGIEAGFGGVLRCTPDLADHFPIAGEVTYGGNTYTVKSRSAPMDDDDLGYVEVILERQR